MSGWGHIDGFKVESKVSSTLSAAANHCPAH